jgi:tetratricopeptide (TPR) repeat protein
VIGKNEKDVDQRIKKLSDATEKFPQYVRLSNEVGLSYGTKKDHRSAIKWYKKCIAIVPEYIQGYNNIACRTELLNDPQ